MRIALSAENKAGLDSPISHHFGRCPAYVLVDVEDQEITSVRSIDNPYYQQHTPGMVPEFIHNQGANVMISGGMGRKAIDFFREYGIEVATGANGTVRTSLEEYLNGDLRGVSPCKGNEAEHHHHD